MRGACQSSHRFVRQRLCRGSSVRACTPPARSLSLHGCRKNGIFFAVTKLPPVNVSSTRRLWFAALITEQMPRNAGWLLNFSLIVKCFAAIQVTETGRRGDYCSDGAADECCRPTYELDVRRDRLQCYPLAAVCAEASAVFKRAAAIYVA